MDSPPALPPFEPAAFLNVGTDAVEVERIRKTLERNGEHFLKKVYTEAEIALCMPSANRDQRLAARFAAKEAASKALGTGIGGHFDWKSVSVESGPHGEPVAVLDERAQRAVAQRGGTRILLSLSHTKDYAFATAVLVK